MKKNAKIIAMGMVRDIPTPPSFVLLERLFLVGNIVASVEVGGKVGLVVLIN